MSQLVLHPVTKKQFDGYIERPTHALLVIGPAGAGKLTIAINLAGRLLAIDPTKLFSKGAALLISPTNGSIGIEAVRELGQFLKPKTIGKAQIRRIVIIENAHLMTIEAQNAFLKSLEEPPADTVIILTAAQQQWLLPTINSRLQVLTFHHPSQQAMASHFNSGPAFDKAYSLSGGLPGLTQALLSDDQDHPLYGAVKVGKSLLQQNTFERLAMVDSLSKDKNQSLSVLEALNRMTQIGIEQAAKKGQIKALAHWQKIMEAVVSTLSALDKNANQKLALTNLMLQL